MQYKIIKNTIPSGIKKDLKMTGDQMLLAVERGLEVIRSNTLPFVPRVSGRLVGSLSGQPLVGGDSIWDIKEQKSGSDIVKVEGKVGTNVPYAKYVEFGTSRFKGRYYMTQGISASKDELPLVIYNTLKK